MAQQMNLTIYIDELLLVGKQENLANLTLSRMVNKKANVIFQSTTPGNFSHSNTFGWTQAYAIGATLKPLKGGAFLQASTTIRDIGVNQVCDWTKNPGQDMPEAEQAPSTFAPGSFGTIGMPQRFKNIIFCYCGDDQIPIYADDNPIPGLSDRSYIVDSIYQLSWESHVSDGGVYAKQWTDPWRFHFDSPEEEADRYLSWGYPLNKAGYPDTTQPAQWYDYQSTDPKRHNPPSAPNLKATSEIEEVKFRLCWNGPKSRVLAGTVENYLQSMTFDNFSTIVERNGSVINGRTSLIELSGSTAALVGTTPREKIKTYLRILLSGLAPKYHPTKQELGYSSDMMEDNFEYSTGNNDLVLAPGPGGPGKPWIKLALGWIGNGNRGIRMAAVVAAANYLNAIIKAHVAPVNVTVTQPVYDSNNDVFTAQYTLENVPANKVSDILTSIERTIASEGSRRAPVPTIPALPTPDPVYIMAVDDHKGRNLMTLLGEDKDDIDAPERNGNITNGGLLKKKASFSTVTRNGISAY